MKATPRISAKKADWPQIMVDLNDDLATNKYVIGPVEMFSKRSTEVRKVVAAAEANGGVAKTDGMHVSGPGPLRALLDKVSAKDTYPVASVEDDEHADQKRRAAVLVTTTGGSLAIFDKEYWEALSHFADEMQSGRKGQAALAYKDGKLIGAIMPIYRG